MAEQPQREFKWKTPRYGAVPEIYTNFVNVSWTLFDLRVRLGHLIPAQDGSGFDAEELAGVTFAWPQAKILAKALTEMVASYEAANGEIKEIKMPADPSITPTAKD